MRRSRSVLFAAAVVVTCAAVAQLAAPAASATVPVTISISSITQLDVEVDPGLFQGPVGDFYAGVTIDGGAKQDNFADRLDFGFEFGVGYIFPFSIPLAPAWAFTQDADTAAGSVAVSVELWDNDDCDSPFCTDAGVLGNPDDQVDISPTASETLNLTINLADGKWSGDATWPQNCVQGTGGEGVRICFDVTTFSTSGDADGDGLLDGWEINGFNGDGDSSIDVDLPGFGANPSRKDVFVEIDCLVSDGNTDGDLADLVDHSHCPRQNAMTDVVQGFANAPVGNVDGTTGIQLHLDTGTLYGAGLIPVAGTGGVAGNVGDMSGGGSQIAEAGNTIIDWDGAAGRPATSFYAIKNANFDRTHRAGIFRYSIFGHQTNGRSATNDCTSGWAEDVKANDFFVTLGGRRDLDANGTTDTTCWAPTLADSFDDDGDGAVDEDAPDGIDNDGDCAPGTDTDDDGTICDSGDLGVDEDNGLSIGSRSQQAGTFMHELGHALGLGHGGGDGVNNKPNYLSTMNYSFQPCTVPTSPAGAAAPIPGGCDYSRTDIDLNEGSLDECVGLGVPLGFGANDWNANTAFEGVTNCVPPNSSNVPADINGDGSTGSLAGFDDWSNIFYLFQGLGNFGDGGPINPVPDEPDPTTIEQAQQYLGGLLAPDVQVAVTGPATAVPGETLTYTVQTSNAGSGPALDLELAATRPDGSTSSFDVGGLVAGAQDSRTVEYTVPLDTCPTTLTVGATAAFVDFVGQPGSASGSAATEVLDVTPPNVQVSLSPSVLSPPNHKLVTISATVTAVDECDPDPQIELVSVTSNEPDNGVADGDKPGDVAGAAVGTDDRSFRLRAERAGTGAGRVYTVTYRASDASGNTSQSTATVRVPHSN